MAKRNTVNKEYEKWLLENWMIHKGLITKACAGRILNMQRAGIDKLITRGVIESIQSPEKEPPFVPLDQVIAEAKRRSELEEV